METIADKLLYLQGTKSAIKDAIVSKGVTVPTGTPFRDYATKIVDITTGGGGCGSETVDEWVRPTEWLPLPDNVDGVEKVSILNAVFDTDSEFVAFNFQGAYTVDWGDGTVENYNSSVKAEHKYNYTNASLNSDTVANYGYKQCIITITPQAGNNLTAIFLNNFHSTLGSSSTYDLTTGFLDIRINSLSCATISIGQSGAINYVKHTMLEQCLIGELANTTLDNLFYDCYALQSVTIKDTSNVTSFVGMHYNNYSLQKMPTYTFRSAGVNINSMFINCYSLIETHPIVVTPSSVSSLQSIFSGCKSLTYVNITIVSDINYSLESLFKDCLSFEDIKISFNGTGKVTSLGYTFQYTRIKSSPVIDTSLCTSFNNTFQNCDRLTDLYEYNYTSATTLAAMLQNCYSLKSIPNFNITNRCTSLHSTFYNCWALEKAPTFSDSSGVTTAFNMLSTCKSITILPSYTFDNMSNTGLGYFASNCDSLEIISNITVGTSFYSNTNFIHNCYSLKRMLAPLRSSFSVANAKMSASALNEMFSILPTSTGQSVSITGNYGASTCDTTIATAKGWTVYK